VFILTWFIFAGTDVAVTKYPVYICGAGHKFYKNVLSLQDENAQCLAFLEEINAIYWNRRNFLHKPVYSNELSIP